MERRGESDVTARKITAPPLLCKLATGVAANDELCSALPERGTRVVVGGANTRRTGNAVQLLSAWVRDRKLPGVLAAPDEDAAARSRDGESP
jgi:hypothetical protein